MYILYSTYTVLYVHILYGRAQRADGFFFFLNSTLVMAHLKRICITMLQHFVPLESRHGRLNSSSGTSACRTSLEKAVEEWRNTKCRRRGRPSGCRLLSVSSLSSACSVWECAAVWESPAAWKAHGSRGGGGGWREETSNLGPSPQILLWRP